MSIENKILLGDNYTTPKERQHGFGVPQDNLAQTKAPGHSIPQAL